MIIFNHFPTSRRHTQLSANANVSGNFNFNMHPILPSETKVLVHETCEQCGTFDFHRAQGSYISPNIYHY